MKSCCEDKAAEIAKLRARQGRILKIVLLINAVMFVVELTAGIISSSTSLLADSLDMLGDALVYGFSLYVLAKSDRWRSGAALLKGIIMTAFGLAVLGDALSKVFLGNLPQPGIISGIGAIALAANAFCLLLLTKHRDDDINMRSTWLCSRNDIIANVGVILAGGLVALTHSKWPDIVVGVTIAAIFLQTSFGVTRESLQGLKVKN